MQAQQAAASSTAAAAAADAAAAHHVDSSEVKVTAPLSPPIFTRLSGQYAPCPHLALTCTRSTPQALQQRIAALEKHVRPALSLHFTFPPQQCLISPNSQPLLPFSPYQLLSNQSATPAPLPPPPSATATSARPSPPQAPSSDVQPAAQMPVPPSSILSNWHMMQALDSRLQEVLALDIRRQHQVSHASCMFSLIAC